MSLEVIKVDIRYQNHSHPVAYLEYWRIGFAYLQGSLTFYGNTSNRQRDINAPKVNKSSYLKV